uniref:Uncharacterized protein n=1 Tax=Macrostomum lignano TaxID=282301 RepID=A0A1I8IL66_9PLAT
MFYPSVLLAGSNNKLLYASIKIYVGSVRSWPTSPSRRLSSEYSGMCKPARTTSWLGAAS